MWRNIWNGAVAAVGMAAGFLWGDMTGLMIALITFICMDYISGVLVAIKRKKLSSAVGYKGILKKCGILLGVAVGHVLDTYVIKSGAGLMAACQAFFIANEGISILENLGRLGVKFPAKVRNVLEALKSESEKEKDKDEKK
jgi:toxin secretion/phage lysis holin